MVPIQRHRHELSQHVYQIMRNCIILVCRLQLPHLATLTSVFIIPKNKTMAKQGDNLCVLTVGARECSFVGVTSKGQCRVYKDLTQASICH